MFEKFAYLLVFATFIVDLFRDISKVAGLFNTLTKKDARFTWTNKCELAFKRLKQCICKASILIYFNLSKQCHIETDLLDYVSAGVLSHEDDSRIFHLVAFYLKRIVLAKCNYEIYNNKLLAII